MINEAYVSAIADYILNKVTNPKTGEAFVLEDIKEGKYIEPVKLKIKELEEVRNERETIEDIS